MNLIVHPAAEGDLSDGYGWYDRQRRGLGEEFLSCVDQAFGSIVERPLSFPIVHKTIRRAILQRFPYCVFFVVADPTIQVLAVFHGRRDPKSWKDRAGMRAADG